MKVDLNIYASSSLLTARLLRPHSHHALRIMPTASLRSLKEPPENYRKNSEFRISPNFSKPRGKFLEIYFEFTDFPPLCNPVNINCLTFSNEALWGRGLRMKAAQKKKWHDRVWKQKTENIQIGRKMGSIWHNYRFTHVNTELTFNG